MRRKSQPRYNGPMMPPISPPGQREYRKLTMHEEILRVPLIIGTQCFLALISLVSTYLIVATIGPIVGFAIGVFILAYAAIKIPWGKHPTKHILFPPLAISSLLWLVAGYPLCNSVWIPNPLSFFHPFAQVAIIIAYLFADVASLWGVYVLWIEITDPNWPSPRQAVLRDGPYIPLITQETYGGQILPTNQLSSPSSSTIRVEVVEENGSIKYIDGIPDTPEWHRFSKYISSKGPRSFTENAAKGFKIKLLDQVVGGVLIVKGMRTVRTELLDRGLAYWHSADHGRGVVLKRPAMLMFDAIGERS